MNGAELKRYATILVERQAELTHAANARERIAIEKAADSVDESTAAGERELAITTVHREAMLRRQMDAALQRIVDGSYGYCVNCDEEISRKRLNAVPWTALCLDCQEQQDREMALSGNGRSRAPEFVAA